MKKFSFEVKAKLLGALGYELVQQRTTALLEREVERLIPEDIRDEWREVLEEIVETSMLERSDHRLRFLHQSFQEYFAARYFLEYEARDEESIREKVRQFGWHDTFIVLVGFTGEAPAVVKQVIDISLKYNPVLTARCLRMAEVPDRELLARFVETQETVLRDSNAGPWAHQRAAQGLTEYARGPARATLLLVATDSQAPSESRVEILNHLAEMPNKEIFEQRKRKILSELVDLLKEIFNQKAPIKIHKAAIKAVVTAGRKNQELKDLIDYLYDFLENANWELKKEAWAAIRELDWPLSPRRKAGFAHACYDQLDSTKEKLFQESVTRRMDGLNRERVMILQQIASPENLPLLLGHRFSLGIEHEVVEIINQVAQAEGEPPAEARQALTILREPISDEAAAIDRLLKLIREGDDATAAAAAHRLESLGEKLPGGKLQKLLAPTLRLDRLLAVARLAVAANYKGMGKKLEQLARAAIKNVYGDQGRETFSGVMLSLIELDRSRGTRLGVVADSLFWTSHRSAQPEYFPWTKVFDRLFPGIEDYQALLDHGGDDARAAVHWLFSKGTVNLVVAETIAQVTLRDKSLRRFRELAEREESLIWQHYYAGAAVKVRATELLPWLISLSENPKLVNQHIRYSHERFGEFNECYLAMVFRSIGYLAQVLVEDGKAKEAEFAVSHLKGHFSSLSSSTEPSVIAGLTTALGYLGEWEPIFSHLSPSEPWMHEAAENIFARWVPRSSEAGKVERDRAARWIARYLRASRSLAPEARSTLQRIKENLETEIGYHVPLE